MQYNNVHAERRCSAHTDLYITGQEASLGTILGRFSIIYFRGLGLRIRVRVWVRVRAMVRVWVRVRIGVWVRVSVVLWPW